MSVLQLCMFFQKQQQSRTKAETREVGVVVSLRGSAAASHFALLRCDAIQYDELHCITCIALCCLALAWVREATGS